MKNKTMIKLQKIKNRLIVIQVLFLLALLIQSANSFAEIDITLRGELTQGGLIIGVAPKGSKLWLGDKLIAQTDKGEFVFGFGRDAALNQTLRWQSPNKVKNEMLLQLSERTYKTQSISGVPAKMVTPKKEVTSRIQAETNLVKEARKQHTDLLFFLDAFKAPLEGQITGVYGSQRVFNGVPKRPHYGLDFAAPTGTLVFAPASGKVTLTHDNMYYSGGTLIVDHGFGVSSTFIHLSEVLVSEGQVIGVGDAIAKVGSGGRSTGPHLDWRVNWFNIRIDPQLVLNIPQH